MVSNQDFYMKNTTALLYAILAFVAFSGCARREPPSRVIEVTVKKFEYVPAEIRLKRGELVEFRVTTADVQHSFDVKQLRISEPVNPGKPAVFQLRPEEAGRFQVECAILCGKGHDDMRATLIVE